MVLNGSVTFCPRSPLSCYFSVTSFSPSRFRTSLPMRQRASVVISQGKRLQSPGVSLFHYWLGIAANVTAKRLGGEKARRGNNKSQREREKKVHDNFVNQNFKIKNSQLFIKWTSFLFSLQLRVKCLPSSLASLTCFWHRSWILSQTNFLFPNENFYHHLFPLFADPLLLQK